MTNKFDENSIEAKTLQKVLQMLNSLQKHGVKYAIVTLHGEKFGDLEVEEPKAKRKQSLLPFGTYSTHCREHLNEDMQAGDVVVIPCGNLDPLIVQSSACSLMNKWWGAAGATTTINRKNKTVEVMRLA